MNFYIVGLIVLVLCGLYKTCYSAIKSDVTSSDHADAKVSSSVASESHSHYEVREEEYYDKKDIENMKTTCIKPLFTVIEVILSTQFPQKLSMYQKFNDWFQNFPNSDEEQKSEDMANWLENRIDVYRKVIGMTSIQLEGNLKSYITKATDCIRGIVNEKYHTNPLNDKLEELDNVLSRLYTTLLVNY